MAMDVKVRFRSFIPGFAGVSSSGVPVQGKQMVVGEIDITSYTSLGEPVTPTDLGLTTIDLLLTEVRLVDATDPATATIFGASYNATSGLLIVSEDLATASAVADSTANVRFLAVGDSASAPSLT